MSRGRAFPGNRDGATAIEFAILALPFLLIVFAIAETALVMFAGLALDSSADKAARIVRTGEAMYKKYSKDEFRKILCQNSLDIFNCNKIYFDLREYNDYKSMPTKPPVANGNLDSSNFTYEIGDPNSIMMLRVYYKWPIITDLMHKYLSNMNDRTFLLSAVSAVRVEPLDVK